MKKSQFRLLKIFTFSAIALLSGLFRAKVIVDLGGVELLGILSTLLAISTFAATIIFGNFWSVTFLHGLSEYKACLPTILFRPLLRACKKIALTFVPLLILVIAFQGKDYLFEAVAVAIISVSQIAVFTTVTFLRGIDNELFLSKVIMLNNFMTTTSIFIFQLDDSNHILIASALCNFLQWLFVLFTYRRMLKTVDFETTKNEYKQMEIESRELLLIPVAPLLFDIYWRLLLLIDTGWNDIGLLQPSVQYLLVMEPMLIHLALALGNDKIRKSVNRPGFKLFNSESAIFLILLPFLISLFIGLASGFYLETFFGEEFTKYEMHFRIILISSVFRFSLILINIKLQSSFSNDDVSKVMKSSILMRIILTTVLLYFFGGLGIVLAIALESAISFLLAYRKLRMIMK